MEINDFRFSTTPQLYFGKESLKLFNKDFNFKSKKYILITGVNSFDTIEKKISFFSTFPYEQMQDHFRIHGEPTVEIIDNIINSCSEIDVNLVVAIGGGSVIDAGKAISAMLPYKDSIAPYLEGAPGFTLHTGIKIPFIALPTTAGTGAEATKNAVISNYGTENYKRSLRHDKFIPDIAIIQPEATYSNSKFVTATSGMDALTQLIESYTSNAANIYTDTLALDGVKKIQQSLKLAYIEPDDYGARANMAYAAYLSGICLANAGLGVVHGFAGIIGGMFAIPHGAICGCLLAESNRMNIKMLQKNHCAYNKYIKLGKIFSDHHHHADDYYVEVFANEINTLSQELSIPKLSELGINTNSYEEIIKKTGLKNNPVILSKENLYEILSRS